MKSGMYLFNPGEVSDRQVAPPKALVEPSSQPPSFSPEQITLFEKGMQRVMMCQTQRT